MGRQVSCCVWSGVRQQCPEAQEVSILETGRAAICANGGRPVHDLRCTLAHEGGWFCGRAVLGVGQDRGQKRSLARAQLNRELEPTIQPTELVAEAYLRLTGAGLFRYTLADFYHRDVFSHRSGKRTALLFFAGCRGYAFDVRAKPVEVGDLVVTFAARVIRVGRIYATDTAGFCDCASGNAANFLLCGDPGILFPDIHHAAVRLQ